MTSLSYPQVDSNPNFPQIENEILKFWEDKEIFHQSLKGKKEFIFYDGPPFANGMPHYGHLLSGFIKDLVARYQTMQGNLVKRRFGWDCHGLPAEMVAEKDLGISGKIEIEAFGIDKFNQYCYNSVLQYAKQWEEQVNRQARWVDFANDYKTMDLPYMESVLWVFKSLYDKGLIYESVRVMPYSWKCETPVSDFETRIDNAYRQIQSKSVTLGFKLKDSSNFITGKYKSIYILAWTTTPWTLPSNLALAVGSDIEYSVVNKDNNYYIIASSALTKYENEIGQDVVTTIKGKDLVGLEYNPVFSYFSDHKNAFHILAADFVTTEDGTGTVHISPGFGEDDYNLCRSNNIDVVCPVDNGGKFTYPVTDYIGKQVFETNDSIIMHLKKIGAWIKTEQYTHNYPHCWRTDTQLIYKALPSWYISVTSIKERMIINNQKINWIPSHIKNGLFGKWLENARDWSISRNRYWGCPIPVWQSDDPEYPYTLVLGSIKELEETFNVKIKDLHRPFIDQLVTVNPADPTGKSMLRRVPEVLDCWFESGSMPYAQIHYPFENKEWFEKSFPADFISEYVAQTRGWFYTMMVISTALFDSPPFLNAICHGVILGEGGQKLSKRLQNYVDPKEVFEQVGADAIRWFMVSSTVMRGQELVLDKDIHGIKEVVRLVIKPLWNAYNFFTLYANIDKLVAEFNLEYSNILDKYIITKTMQTAIVIRESLDRYDTITATAAVEELIEVLNNWYIRRSRERFWRSDIDKDKVDAYNALFSVLNIVCRAVAPLLPLIAEAIFRGINIHYADKISVHLEDFPNYSVDNIDHDLIRDMERVRSACNSVLNIRNQSGIRVRQPLAKATFIGVTSEGFSEEMKQLVLEEINVKSWENLSDEHLSQYANYKLQLNLPLLGKRIPNKVQTLIKEVRNGEWKFTDDKTVIVGTEILLKEEFKIQLEPKEEFKDKACALDTHDALVILDLKISEKLWQEGIVRDLVRSIQQLRKESGLNVCDKIIIKLSCDGNEIANTIKEWNDYITKQTLANLILFEDINNLTIKQNKISWDNNDNSIYFSIHKDS